MQPFYLLLVVATVVSSSELSKSILLRSSLPSNDWSSIKDVISNLDDLANEAESGVAAINDNIDIIHDAVSSIIGQIDDIGILEQRLDEAGDDIDEVVAILNEALQSEVFVVNSDDDTLRINVNGLQSVVLRLAKNIIKQTVPNRWQQRIVYAQVEREVRNILTALKPIIESDGIPLEILRKLLRVPLRKTRSLQEVGDKIRDILVGLVRARLGDILTVVRDQITGSITDIINNVTLLYVAIEPDNPILAAVGNILNVGVIRITQVLVNVNVTINAVFDNILGTNDLIEITRKRREISQDLSRKIDLPAILTSPLNRMAKKIIANIIESRYEQVGRAILDPIEALINLLINRILPCPKC